MDLVRDRRRYRGIVDAGTGAPPHEQRTLQLRLRFPNLIDLPAGNHPHADGYWSELMSTKRVSLSCSDEGT